MYKIIVANVSVHHQSSTISPTPLTTKSTQEEHKASTSEPSNNGVAFNLKQAPVPVGAYAHSRIAGGLLFLAGNYIGI